MLVAIPILLADAVGATEAASPSMQNGPIVASWFENGSGNPRLISGYPARGLCGGFIARGGTPAFSPDASKLAFANEVSPGTPQLFVANPDGTDAEQITFGEQGASGPVFSPDASMLAFHSRVSGAEEGSGAAIWTVGIDGSNARQITDAQSGGPVFSPDGSAIVFTKYRLVEKGVGTDSVPTIWIVDANGTGARPLTIRRSYDPVFSPDGSTIAFIGEPGGGRYADLYLMNADGSGVRRLETPENVLARSPTFSPDGGTLVFGTGYGLAVIGVDGSGYRELPTFGGDDLAISPDGKWVAYSSSSGGARPGDRQSGYIRVIRLDGVGDQRIDYRASDLVGSLAWRQTMPGETMECADFDPFEFTQDAEAVQRVGRAITVSVTCSAACRASLEGTARVASATRCPSCPVSAVPLRKGSSVSLPTAGSGILRLRPGRKARKTLRRAIRRGDRVEAWTRVDVFDPIRGKHHEAELTVRLVR